MALKLRIDDIQRLAKSAAEIAAVVGPVVATYGPKAVDAVAEYGPKAAEAAANAAKAVGAPVAKAGNAVAGAASKAVGGAKQTQGDKEQEKILRQAREDAIKSSAYGISAKGFMESSEANRSLGMASGGYMALPGCFAILLLPNSHTKDYAKFKEVYIGSSLSMGDCIYGHLTGNGNADVYADIKYNQPIHILLYPCDESQMDAVKASLILNMQAFGSYNAREVANS